MLLGIREVHEARWSRTCSRPCAFEGKKTKNKEQKIRPILNTPQNPQPPGDRDQLDTACGETRPTR